MRPQSKYKNDSRTLISLISGRKVATALLQKIDYTPGLSPALNAEGEVAAVCINVLDVVLDSGQYNEAYLADLRDFLKTLEKIGTDAIIVPVLNGNKTLDVKKFVERALHIARRIKDCEGVAGFALPDDAALNPETVSMFIDAMSVKHPQYVYFSSNKTQDSRLIPYSLR